MITSAGDVSVTGTIFFTDTAISTSWDVLTEPRGTITLATTSSPARATPDYKAIKRKAALIASRPVIEKAIAAAAPAPDMRTTRQPPPHVRARWRR